MTLEKDTLHVVIRLPFKRPHGFIGPPPILWTDEMEQRLRQYMSQKHKDWNYIAEQLGVPSSYLVRHAAFIYETQLREVQQQLRLSDTNKAPPASHRRNVSATTLSTPPPPQRYNDITETSADAVAALADARAKPQEDVMMLSAISNVAPRVPLHQQQEEESDISSVIEESLYKSIQSSRSFYSPEESMNKGQNMSDEDEKEDDQEGPGADDFSRQFGKMQMEEEPAFLPQTVKRESFLMSQRRSRRHLRQNDQDDRGSTISLGSSDSSITQSALEDAFLSRLNNGSKMSSLAFSKR